MSILSLPPEVLADILSFLNYESAKAAIQSHRIFYNTSRKYQKLMPRMKMSFVKIVRDENGVLEIVFSRENPERRKWSCSLLKDDQLMRTEKNNVQDIFESGGEGNSLNRRVFASSEEIALRKVLDYILQKFDFEELLMSDIEEKIMETLFSCCTSTKSQFASCEYWSDRGMGIVDLDIISRFRTKSLTIKTQSANMLKNPSSLSKLSATTFGALISSWDTGFLTDEIFLSLPFSLSTFNICARTSITPQAVVEYIKTRFTDQSEDSVQERVLYLGVSWNFQDACRLISQQLSGPESFANSRTDIFIKKYKQYTIRMTATTISVR